MQIWWFVKKIVTLQFVNRCKNVILLLMIAMPLLAQSNKAGKVQIPTHIRAWHIEEGLGVADTCGIDTAVVSYPDANPVNAYSIANAWNGNLGSPLQSRIYFDRTAKTPTFHSQPYDAYLVGIEDVTFFNTTTPFAELEYRSALPTFYEQDHFKALFTMNANSRTNFGGLVNLIYGRGQYANQATRMLNGGLWGSYNGRRYSAQGMVMFNNFRNHESGGITDRNYILDPTAVAGGVDVAVADIPTRLNAIVGYSNYLYYYNHKFCFGYEKERRVNEDSVAYDYIPVTSIVHTIKFEDTRRRYVERDSLTNGFYADNFYQGSHTLDSTRYWSLKNTLGVTMEEKFNRLMRFGLTGFVEYDLRRYRQFEDSIPLTDKHTEHNLKVGAQIFKREGEKLTFDVNGDVYVVGPKIGNFSVYGGMRSVFPITAKDTMTIEARGGFYNESCDYLLQHYLSNHFRWENDFDNELRFNVKGRIAFPTRHISVGVQFENVTNFIYFDHNAQPAQFDGNVQVIAADVTANLRAWRIHLDNQLVYQFTSNREVLPLPDFALYSNLYYLDSFFKKVLTMQLGVSVRYHTAYYGNNYMPATGVFYVQNEHKIGNYPEMNVYLNFFIKRLRLYVQYANWNATLFGRRNYFSMPYYPLNPATFQFGLSWTFYD